MVDKRNLKEYIKNETVFLGQLKGAKEEGKEERQYKVCEAMLNANEDIKKISLYTKLSIDEITSFQKSLKKRRLN